MESVRRPGRPVRSGGGGWLFSLRLIWWFFLGGGGGDGMGVTANERNEEKASEKDFCPNIVAFIYSQDHAGKILQTSI